MKLLDAQNFQKLLIEKTFDQTNERQLFFGLNAFSKVK